MATVADRNWPLSANERTFLLEALASGIRCDGRRRWSSRPIALRFYEGNGAAEAALGESRAFAAITADVVPPFPDRPSEGLFAVRVHASPLASADFPVDGGSTSVSVELGKKIERGLRESRPVDTEALCLIAGEAVWSVRLDIHIVNHGGGLADLCSIAAAAALQNFRLPETEVNNGKLRIFSVFERVPVELPVLHLPFCVSFAFLDEGETVVADPDDREEAVAEGYLSLITNKHMELCAVFKSGGPAVESSLMMRCLKYASARAKEHAKHRQMLNATRRNASFTAPESVQSRYEPVEPTYAPQQSDAPSSDSEGSDYASDEGDDVQLFAGEGVADGAFAAAEKFQWEDSPAVSEADALESDLPTETMEDERDESFPASATDGRLSDSEEPAVILESERPAPKAKAVRDLSQVAQTAAGGTGGADLLAGLRLKSKGKKKSKSQAKTK